MSAWGASWGNAWGDAWGAVSEVNSATTSQGNQSASGVAGFTLATRSGGGGMVRTLGAPIRRDARMPIVFSGAAATGQGGQAVDGEASFVDTELEHFALFLMAVY